jgi:predicted MPP superfamily phosphohydrolase
MKISRRKFLFTSIGLAIIGFLTDWFWEIFFIKFQHFYLGKADKGKDNIKLIQVSDLHLQSLHFGIRQMCHQINALQPDLICFTGDSVDKAENLNLLEDFLKLLDYKIAKVAILGNWEYWGKINLSALTQLYQKYNIRLLVNENQLFTLKNKKFLITGTDSSLGGKADYLEAIESHELFDYHIVMTHCPAYRDYIVQDYEAQPKIDLILAGHTHGGQINILGYTPFLPQQSKPYVSGWYKEKEPIMFVSKGIGTSIAPLRLGARAEVCVFEWII